MPVPSNKTPGLLKLHSLDNVLTATRSLEAGEHLLLEGQSITLTESIPIGYKVSACDIREGEKIFKYGVPIGSARCQISAGTVVHTHNLQSDYLPTYTLDGKNSYLKIHS